ncbi:MAG: hypothetical protein KJO42_06050 [Silicimonas sp.]|nr:hypothetical protein [Silicimonas sp.]NNF89866.1 hypothetical protein [Boseongicola sp.]NND20012.1 hypothetical protein [Silicimonas sp.]NND22862.1 hypothetical protein [Silicimonas sp.]NND42446.1 hypothetical protein [Silicimonas sp.]
MKKLSNSVTLDERKSLTDFLSFSTRRTADAKRTLEHLQASLSLARRHCLRKA